ncbi:MAG: hypothetical protein KGH74_05500 [Candidatus Micrarchaeota archaeon]|nr:hypothetical protein [Candidatus Micrarchaeota archaeon]
MSTVNQRRKYYGRWKALSYKTRVLLSVLGIATLTIGAVFAQSLYFQTTNTFTVGNVLAVSNASLVKNGNLANIPSGSQPSNVCTLSSGSSWSCPTTGFGTLFSGDNIQYWVVVETDKGGFTPYLSVNATGYSAYTTISEYFTLNFASYWSAGSCTGGGCVATSGLPSMTAGTFYLVVVNININGGAGSPSFSVGLGH